MQLKYVNIRVGKKGTPMSIKRHMIGILILKHNSMVKKKTSTIKIGLAKKACIVSLIEPFGLFQLISANHKVTIDNSIKQLVI